MIEGITKVEFAIKIADKKIMINDLTTLIKNEKIEYMRQLSSIRMHTAQLNRLKSELVGLDNLILSVKEIKDNIVDVTPSPKKS